jgi:uncharacterized protein YcaQ
VASPLKLSRADAARALVRHHFAPAENQQAVFDRLRSIQFDPIAPVGCNHDLVLQARLPGYRVGDWQKIAYQDRLVYDGWDKQASLVPFEGWPLRRIFHLWDREHFARIFDGHPEAVEAVLKELQERGPLTSREFTFQQRKEEWKGSWHGPNLSKQTLRALWHSGQVMTAGRKGGHHVYDLTERVVPARYYNQPLASEQDSLRELILERHRAVGILRPVAPPEVWSYNVKAPARRAAIGELVGLGRLVPVDLEGVAAHATPEFLANLELPPPEPRVVFVAPLDQFMWDRGMIAHIFGFEYSWEIYTPEAKRRWGYYVLPVLFGNDLVARVEFWSREGLLEIRQWHWEVADLPPTFFTELERALRDFMSYCSASKVRALPHIDPKVASLALALSSS